MRVVLCLSCLKCFLDIVAVQQKIVLPVVCGELEGEVLGGTDAALGAEAWGCLVLGVTA